MARIAQQVERLLCKQMVAGSIPALGSKFHVGQSRPVARLSHKQEVAGSNPAPATISPSDRANKHRQYLT
jgi:hypothetical protein